MVAHHVWWAGVASRAHLIYGASWLRQLSGDVHVSMFPLRSFLGAPALTLEDVRAVVPEHVKVSAGNAPGHLPSAEKQTLLSVGAVGIKPYLQVRRHIGVRHLSVVVTDEGFGTYGNWASRRQAWKRQGVREPWRSLRTAGVTAASAALASDRWLLHRRVANDWLVNRHIADEFRRHRKRERADNGAVFLTQPWPELGVLSERAYLDHIEDVAAACADVGLAFSIHPHPAEPVDRYHRWQVHRGQGLAELDQRTVNATLLLGATSTAMLNIAAIHGVPAMRVEFAEFPALEDTHSAQQTALLRHHLGATVPSDNWRAKLSELGAARPEK